MAYRISNSDTTLSSATGWDTVTNTPTLHASTNLTTSGSASYSAAFTAPNTTNKSTGCAVMLISTGAYSSGDMTLTLTLQEYNGASWVDTAATSTITTNTTALGYTAGSWVYFRFGSPYTFTTTTAGYYRMKVVRGSATSSPTLRMDSGGSNFAYMATDDRTGAIGSTDNLAVLGINLSLTTVTIDGTYSIGSSVGAGYTTVPASGVTLSYGFYIGMLGKAVGDTTASTTITCAGNFVMTIGSKLNIATEGTPLPSSNKFKWIFAPATSGDFSFVSYNGTVELYGAMKSSTSLWKSSYVSGTGTAASPLVVSDAVDWEVNDEICITSTGDGATNYNEVEYRYIKTKNSSTSYVLSSTVGGAESAFTYTHTTEAIVLNIERNIVFTTTNTTRAMSMRFGNDIVTNAPDIGTVSCKWIRAEVTGTSSSNTYNAGVVFVSSPSGTFTYDYCVSYICPYSGFYGGNNLAEVTINGLIICKSGSNYGLYGQAMANKTFNDMFIVDGTAIAMITYASNCVFNRMVINACRKTAANTTSGALGINLSTNVEFNDCEIGACGTAISLREISSNIRFNNCSIGVKGNNAFDIAGSYTYHGDVLFDGCTFGSTTFFNLTDGYTYTNLMDGSEVLFHDFNSTTNKHIWYTPYGIAQATGSGLDDTLVRTPGSLNVRISPSSLTPGFTWKFFVPANTNQVCSFSGFFLKNVAMGTDVCTVSLFLPGNPLTGTPDDTATLSDDVSNAWTGSAVQSVSLAAYYTGSVDSFATVVINAKSTTSGAYLYCADFYNSGDATTLYDKLAGLTIWYNGKPSPIITQLSLGGIAPAVWGVATAGLTAAGTTGAKLNHIDDVLSNEIE